MRTPNVTVIGAGAGGLAAAADLAREGVRVTVLEKAGTSGGKIRTEGPGIDAGPTVLTMRWVFEELFAAAGVALEDRLTLHPTDLLARHAWSDTERLDLFADPDRSADAIAAFAGPAEARGYRTFRERAQRVYRTLEEPFIRAPRPTAFSLAAGAGVAAMLGISPFSTLWNALGEHFRDPRLRQLFGRYATYSGSSPFQAPATLMLIAHVEEQGVWLVEGGMIRVAQALAALGEQHGAVIRYDAPVREIVVRQGEVTGVVLESGERLDTDAVVCNSDFAALAAGAFGVAAEKAVPAAQRKQRSLSAVTWTMVATTNGFPLTRHNVFFGGDSAAEFDAVLRHDRLPADPTVYICAQDRGEPGPQPDGSPERLLLLINAPPTGDQREFPQAEIDQCTTRIFSRLERCGLSIQPSAVTAVTNPNTFARMFPATGGALYGQAMHGSMAAFRRPSARSAISNLYLAGGSVHPGPGVPMAVLSGRLAARSLLQDLTFR